MKKEQKVLYLNIFVNLFVSFIKIIGGILGNAFTLVIDGFYTVSDLVTDVIALLGIKIGRKRANKTHPLGYGKAFFVAQLFMSLTAVFVGVAVICLSFVIDYQKPSIWIIFIIMGTVLLKLFSANKLYCVGLKNKSDLLISSGFESKTEAYSSLGLIIIILLSQLIPKIDMIGGLVIAVILIIQSLKTIKQNISLLIGIVFDDEEVREKINQVIKKYPAIDVIDLDMFKNGPYYQLVLTFKVKKNLKVGNLLRLQSKIKKELKAKTLNLKYIEFRIT